MIPLERLETSIDAALARVCDGEVTRGTAFFVLRGGIALTCHHVVDQAGSLELRGVDGRTYRVRQVEPWPEFDLALLQCESGSDAPIALAADPDSSRDVFTKGYQHQGDGARTALPALLAIRGLSAGIQYSAHRTYELASVCTLVGDKLGAGVSGAPLVRCSPRRG